MARKTFSSKYQMQSTPKLKSYKRDLANMEKRLIFCVGLPSTGKTRCAVEIGLQQVLEGKYEKLIIVRPVILPKCGLLKGTLEDKMAPYTRQVNVYCEAYSGRTIEDLERNGQIEILPADLLQGDRFQNAFVILDELQNIHKDETFAILSRVGENSKFVVIGDNSKGQENKKVKQGNSILDYCLETFYNKDYVGIHKFYEIEDLLGDECTKDIIMTLLPDFM